jgi:hypothetical protein
MNMRAFAFSVLSALAVGCDNGVSVPSLPTAQPSVVTDAGNPLPFNGILGVTIGTEGFATFSVQNIGSQNMVVSTVTYTGDSAITLSPGVSSTTADAGTILTPPVTLPYNASLLVGLTCTPVRHTPEVKETYNGLVEIKSNASNLPDITTYVQCVGVPLADGGP